MSCGNSKQQLLELAKLYPATLNNFICQVSYKDGSGNLGVCNCTIVAHRDETQPIPGTFQVVTLSAESIEALAEAIDKKSKEKRRHRVSASGVATGVPTPPPNPHDPSTVTFGPLTMSRHDYDEAHRYFNLFQDAIASVYPSGGYCIGLHEASGQCVMKGRTTADIFKFPFHPDAIKNHYGCFRLLSNFDNYLVLARRQNGRQENIQAAEAI